MIEEEFELARLSLSLTFDGTLIRPSRDGSQSIMLANIVRGIVEQLQNGDSEQPEPVVRRETRNVANDAVAKVESLKQQAGKLANDTQANVRDGIASVREQGEAKASQFSADVEARLAPVLVKLGLKPKARKAARGRKPTKKAAAKRATPARKKPAAKRAVRKTRA